MLYRVSRHLTHKLYTNLKTNGKRQLLHETPHASTLAKLNSVFDVAYRVRFMNIDRRPLMREIDCGTLASSATHQFDPCRFQPRTRASYPAPYNARPTFFPLSLHPLRDFNWELRAILPFYTCSGPPPSLSSFIYCSLFLACTLIVQR